jgi:hypothetical protein
MSSTTKGILRLLRDLMAHPAPPLPRSRTRGSERPTLSPRGLPTTMSYDRSASAPGEEPRYAVNPLSTRVGECPALLAELDGVHIVRR